MSPKDILPQGPGAPERFVGTVIAAAAAGAAAGSYELGRQTNNREAEKTADDQAFKKLDRQEHATIKMDKTIELEAKRITWTRSKVKSGELNKQEGEDILTSLKIPSQALYEGSWNPVERSIKIKEAEKKRLSQEDKGKASRPLSEGGGGEKGVQEDEGKASRPLRGGGERGVQEERFTSQTVSIDPTPAYSSPAKISYQRSIGAGLIVFTGSFILLRVCSEKIRTHRYSNNIAAWCYSAFAPPSEKLSDFSERTDTMLEDLHKKLDRGAIRDEEILKLLKSLNEKL